jgi:hypothetical protein
MAIGPRKNSGLAQGIFETSTTKKERLGRTIDLDNGMKFVYGMCGAAATTMLPGRMSVTKNTATHDGILTNGVVKTAAAAGANKVEITLSTAITLAVNSLQGSLFIIRSATAYGTSAASGGHQYTISGNLASASTTVTIFLDNPLHTALVATAPCAISPCKWGLYGVTTSTTQALAPTGVPLVAVASGSYAWFCIEGLCGVLSDAAVGTTAVSLMPVTLSPRTAGAITTRIVGIPDQVFGYRLAQVTYSPVGYIASTSLAASTIQSVYVKIRS